MPEETRVILEISFTLIYLVTVWALVIAMLRNRSQVLPESKRAADLVLWAFLFVWKKLD